jgi:hypothetical protein
MSFKSWFLDRLQIVGGAVTRADLGDAPARGEPALVASERISDGYVARPEPSLDEVVHLGAYGPLVAAIRDELEHFVASHVRLHLAIADRDRFLLTAIAVSAAGDEERRRQLERFMREFKPEQLKRYVARELIAGLPNASAIDLSQFAGLVDAEALERPAPAGDYRELIAALTAAPSGAAARPYRVELVGRWTELDAPRASTPARAREATPPTPLAGPRCEFDLEDADGRRRVVLPSVLAARRYVVGKGEGCDIRVNGVYASRRHAELWLEGGAWWAADAGSTNGIRVEDAKGVAREGDADGTKPLALGPGDRLVLSARAEGQASDYPWIAPRAGGVAASRPTPIASAASPAARDEASNPGEGAVPKTPLTAVLGETAVATWTLTLVQSSGTRTLEMSEASLPLGVGRSRSQALIVDRAHDGVSGRHLEVVGLEDDGVRLVVHGDNGILVDGVAHGCGGRLTWRAGELLVLGAAAADARACTLSLARRAAGDA